VERVIGCLRRWARFENQNSKHEVRNSKQAQSSNNRNADGSAFEHLNFDIDICFVLRASDFVLEWTW
jgi:hypothetical protein